MIFGNWSGNRLFKILLSLRKIKLVTLNSLLIIFSKKDHSETTIFNVIVLILLVTSISSRSNNKTIGNFPDLFAGVPRNTRVST